MSFQNIADTSAVELDLTTCDTEPIHIPGKIQPHGALIALDGDSFRITHASDNLQQKLGMNTEKLIKQTVAEHFGEAFDNRLRKMIEKGEVSQNPAFLAQYQARNNRLWQVLAHQYQQHFFLEFEPDDGQSSSQLELFTLLIGTIERLRSIDNTAEFLRQAVLEIKKINGFDRVMVYKFDKDGHGEVISEAKEKDLAPFLGLHYPASDIPKQARALYLKNRLRFITDVNYLPVELSPPTHAETAKPLDLSHSILRSVSPIHIEYLQNMGVSATMVISLVKENELWGLIACHNYSPRYVNHDIRAICDNLAHFIMQEVLIREQREEQEIRNQVRSLQPLFIDKIIEKNSVAKAWIEFQPQFEPLIDAWGTVIRYDGETLTTGEVPEQNFTDVFAYWLGIHQRGNSVFHSDRLPELYPKAEAFKHLACGVLAVPLSSDWKNYIIWFRPEAPRTVDWAGDPHKPVKIQKNGERLTPRGSFKLWQEMVNLQAFPWLETEIATALEIKVSIKRHHLQKTEALEERERQFRTFANSVPQLAWLADSKGQIYWCNQRWEDYTGIVSDEMITNDWHGFVDDAHRKRVKDGLQKAQISGSPWEDSFPMAGQNGQECWFLSRILPLKDEHGIIFGWLGTYTDISDIQEAKNALAKNQEELEKRVAHRTEQSQLINTELESFSYSVSHDLRAPLRAINGFSAALEESFTEKLSDESQQYFSYIKSETKRMSQLIDGILELSRLNKSKLHITTLNLSDMAECIIRELQIDTPRPDIEIVIRKNMTVQADEQLMQSVIQNLLENAWKFTKKKNNARIEFSTFQNEQDEPVFFVRDNGAGFDMAYAGKLFGAFQRLHGVSEFPGTGIGLATVQRIINRHQGRIWAESVIGDGATFYFTLPIPTEQ